MELIVKDNKVNRKKCICPGCPSYPQGCKEMLYCSTGKSKCDVHAAGCMCNECPVYEENELRDIYFCGRENVNGIWMRKRSLGEDRNFYNGVVNIKDVAESNRSIVSSMGSQKRMPFTLNDIHFVPAQVYKIPLNAEENVSTEVVIGPRCTKPLKVSSPIMISGMSFGAVSRKVKNVISQVALKLGVGFNTGEGGVLPEDLESLKYMITQYSTGRFGINDELLKQSTAIEIRFGQGAYPGKGSYLPSGKITPEVAQVRKLKAGEDAYSPARHPDMNNHDEIRDKMTYLRAVTKGIPIGAKIGCGNIEADIKVLVDCGVDFIAIDGFGGGTGATDYFVRENVGIPLIAAIPRADMALRKLNARGDVTLIAGGGLRTSADFAKCLALGADAVYIGTAALIAINCQQYRICHTGLCPTGVTTHLPSLLEHLDANEGVKRLSNFLEFSTHEVAALTRIVGKNNVNDLGPEDIVSLKKDLAELTGVKWINGK